MRALLYGNTFPRLWQDMKSNPGKWLARLVYLLGPWVSLQMVEWLNGNDILLDLQPWQVLMNLIWYYILFWLCRLLLGRLRRAGALAALISFGIGLVNHYVLRFRGRILFPADIPAWRTAANVAGGFDFSMDLAMQQAVLLLIAYLFLLYACPAQRRRMRLPLPAALLPTLAAAVYTFVFFFTGALPALGIYTQQWVTQANGFLLNFTVALRYSVVEKPQGYSRGAVSELMERYPASSGREEVTRPANIIVIMNESFSDMTIFDDLVVSADPTPFLHSMKENTIQGWMYSPVTGGGTASVEFEYLTGFSNLFLPPHTVAYQLYMEENMPSLAAVLGPQGYRRTAFHPYRSSGWNRPVAYEYLGFDAQLYEEDVEDPYYVRYYISDRTDYQVLRSITEEDREQSHFIFNVTMQNHGGYAQNWNNLPLAATLSKELQDADSSAQQYFSLAKSSDTALRELISYYQTVDEPTLIVLFGDHQPPLNNAFYEVLYGKSLDDRSAGEVLQRYVVPFFIWANYDIPEQEDVILSPNFLGVLTAQTAGLPMTGWMTYLADLYGDLPVITPVGFITGGGEVVSKAADLSPELQERLREYELLCYCGLIDLDDELRPFFLDAG